MVWSAIGSARSAEKRIFSNCGTPLGIYSASIQAASKATKELPELCAPIECVIDDLSGALRDPQGSGRDPGRGTRHGLSVRPNLKTFLSGESESGEFGCTLDFGALDLRAFNLLRPGHNLRLKAPRNRVWIYRVDITDSSNCR